MENEGEVFGVWSVFKLRGVFGLVVKVCRGVSLFNLVFVGFVRMF